MMQSPFHAGELQVQRKAGEEHMAARTGAIIKNFLPPGALQFIGKQHMVIASSVDNNRQIWTSILVGAPGFITALDQRIIKLNLSSIVGDRAADPFWKNIENERNIGLLFIELATRRRLRVNGAVASADGNLHVSVAQAYPNCPKYIQRREMKMISANLAGKHSIKRGSGLTTDLKEWIENSDTFFVGSSDGHKNMDASHRGGHPGFVQILDAFTLKIPDYPGNNMFNTLGNLTVNPKAGLLFVDFGTGKTLQLRGETKVMWDETGTEESTGGTKRFWTFSISEWVQVDALKGINWGRVDYSPFNP